MGDHTVSQPKAALPSKPPSATPPPQPSSGHGGPHTVYLPTIHRPIFPTIPLPLSDVDNALRERFPQPGHSHRLVDRLATPTWVGNRLFVVHRLPGSFTSRQPLTWSRPFLVTEPIDENYAMAQFNNLQFRSDIMEFFSDLWASLDAWDRVFYHDIGPTSDVRYNLWSTRQELVEVWTAVYSQYLRCWQIQHPGSPAGVGLLIQDV